MSSKTIKRIISVLFAIALACFAVACGGATSELIPEPPHEVHQCTKITAKAATCEKEGNIEYWECYGCDKIFSSEDMAEELTLSQVTLPKLAHAPILVDATEPTCSVEGNQEYWCCQSCFGFFQDENCQNQIADKSKVVVKTLPHNLNNIPAVEPYLYQNGNIEYWSCEDCYQYFIVDEVKGMQYAITQEETVVLSEFNIVDFVVEVDANKDPIVLQLSDTQIMDAGQIRPGDSMGDEEFWATDKVDERCYNYITEIVTAVKPDLILITGDIVYGKFDDSGSALLGFIEFMEGFDIPWAPVFGNHDNESKKGVDWQCEQFEKAENCLFKQRTLTGNGNYSVAIAQGGKIKRVFYMLDSNGCGAASDESLANGHTVKTFGFGDDQIVWYTEQITALKQRVESVKISFVYHIQQAIFGKAYSETYGFKQELGEGEKNAINIDKINLSKEDSEITDFGYIGAVMKNPWDENYRIYNAMKALGMDSIFVGHEHCNSASVVYDGVRFQFGQKSSEYDRFNYLHTDGTISSSFKAGAKSLMGGTVVPLSKDDGAILSPYIYYCGFENGIIDWSEI